MKTDKLISAQQVAEMIGLDEKTILAGKGGTDGFTRVKVGKRGVRFSFNEVQAWIARLLQQAREETQQRLEKQRATVKRHASPSQDDVSRVIAPFQRG